MECTFRHSWLEKSYLAEGFMTDDAHVSMFLSKTSAANSHHQRIQCECCTSISASVLTNCCDDARVDWELFPWWAQFSNIYNTIHQSITPCLSILIICCAIEINNSLQLNISTSSCNVYDDPCYRVQHKSSVDNPLEISKAPLLAMSLQFHVAHIKWIPNPTRKTLGIYLDKHWNITALCVAWVDWSTIIDTQHDHPRTPLTMTSDVHVLLATMPFRRHRVPRWVSVKVLNPYYNPLSAAVRVARTTAGTHFSENSQKKRNSTCICGSLVVDFFLLSAGSPVLLWDSGFRSPYYAELSFLRGNTTQQSRHQILSLSVCQVCVCYSVENNILHQ